MPRLFPLVVGAAAGVTVIRVRRARGRAERLAAALLETVLRAIDANDAETGRHVRRVARYALILADAAGLDEHEQRKVERVALFHDIGKISEALFDIIHDDSKLSPDERREIATHPQRGADVLAPLEAFYPDLPDGVLAHHERWDGTGYPRRLRGQDIPIAARVVAIADTFDAIAFSRRYRRGRGARFAAERIAGGRGTQFDPDLTDLFLFPPVFDQVEEAMHDAVRKAAAPAVPRSRADRRRGRQETDAPDVNFRWRDAAVAPPRQDPPPRRSPG
jgi:putative two-component system response regulator